MKNQNSKFKHVLSDYDVEWVEIHNYDLSAKLKDKIKIEKSNNIAKDKESKMAKKSKIDLLYEVVLNLKEEFSEFKTEVKSEIQEIKNDLNNFKTEVREEFSKVNSRLDKLEDDVNVLKNDVNILKDDVNVLKSDVHILKQDVNSLKSEAIKHGWNIN